MIVKGCINNSGDEENIYFEVVKMSTVGRLGDGLPCIESTFKKLSQFY